MKNVLIITYWSFKDPLIQTYTLPYVKIIAKNINQNGKIYLFTMEQDFHKMDKSSWDKEKKILAKENINLIRFRYSRFGFKMIVKFLVVIIKLLWLIISEKITRIHSWCTPGGAIGYILSVITRKPLIIDSYEPHAESMVENGEWQRTGKAFKILFWLEKKMSRRAKTVIALTEGMRGYAQQKYNAEFENYYVKPSLVDLQKFSFDNIKENSLVQHLDFKDKIVCLYAGKFGGIYLEKEVFDLLKVAYSYWGEKFKVLLLTNTLKDEIFKLASKVQLPENLFEVQFVDYSEIEKYFKLADFAINPVKPVPSKRYCTSIKDGEYWAMGLPVIITKDISDDSEIIEKENIGAVINELNNEEYKKAVSKIDKLLKTDRMELRKRIRNIAIKYRHYNIAENIYKEIYG